MLAALATSSSTLAHSPASPTSGVFVATVSSIEPNIVGLEARIVLNDELVVTNRTESPAAILNEAGRTLHTIAARRTFAWHDRRLGTSGPPPQVAEGAPKNWRIPGRVRGERFAIEGFTGYVPPPAQPAADDGSSPVLPVVAAVVLLAIAAGAVYLFERRRG